MTEHRAEALRPLDDEGLVYCMVGDRHYAMRGADVRAIERGENLRPPSPDDVTTGFGGAGAHGDGLVGTIEIEGRSVPVFALARLLRHDAEPRPLPPVGAALSERSESKGGMIAVTGANGEMTGWLADRVARAEAHVAATIVPLPPIVGAAAARWFDGVVKLGKTMLLLLAPNRLHAATPDSHPAPDPRPDPDSGPSPDSSTSQPEGPLRRDHAGARLDDPGADPIVVVFAAPALPRGPVSRYALSGRQVAAVVTPTPPLPVPGSPPHVLGLTWWREAPVPVVDFREPPERGGNDARGRRMVARCGGRLRGTLVAFAIEPDMSLHRPAGDDQMVTDVECPPFAAGVFRVGGDMVALLQLDGLIG
jgi:chemotaxis signal transduction protein